MLFGEFLVLLGIVAGSSFGIIRLQAWARNSRERRRQLEVQTMLMRADLKNALESKDYRRLDDFLVLYSDIISKDIRLHVSLRRDELFIEQNP